MKDILIELLRYLIILVVGIGVGFYIAKDKYDVKPSTVASAEITVGDTDITPTTTLDSVDIETPLEFIKREMGKKGYDVQIIKMDYQPPLVMDTAQLSPFIKSKPKPDPLLTEDQPKEDTVPAVDMQPNKIKVLRATADTSIYQKMSIRLFYGDGTKMVDTTLKLLSKIRVSFLGEPVNKYETIALSHNPVWLTLPQIRPPTAPECPKKPFWIDLEGLYSDMRAGGGISIGIDRFGVGYEQIWKDKPIFKIITRWEFGL